MFWKIILLYWRGWTASLWDKSFLFVWSTKIFQAKTENTTAIEEKKIMKKNKKNPHTTEKKSKTNQPNSKTVSVSSETLISLRLSPNATVLFQGWIPDSKDSCKKERVKKMLVCFKQLWFRALRKWSINANTILCSVFNVIYMFIFNLF